MSQEIINFIDKLHDAFMAAAVPEFKNESVWKRERNWVYQVLMQTGTRGELKNWAAVKNNAAAAAGDVRGVCTRGG